MSKVDDVFGGIFNNRIAKKVNPITVKCSNGDEYIVIPGETTQAVIEHYNQAKEYCKKNGWL